MGQRNAGGVKSLSRAAISASLISTCQLAIGNVEVNDVALANCGDRAANKRFWRHVAGGEAARRAAETAVGEQRHRARSAQRCELMAAVTCSISRMPGPPLGPS